MLQMRSILGVWNYDRAVLDADRDLIGSIDRVMKTGGCMNALVFISISNPVHHLKFAQLHWEPGWRCIH